MDGPKDHKIALVKEVITRKEKYLQEYRSGPLEDEICLDPKTDLQKYYDNCQKDPGHANFKPHDNFSMTDIPEKYRTLEMFNLIQSLFYITVQVQVKGMISPERIADKNFNIHKLYECFSGAQAIRYGTGKVNKITELKCNKGQHCPCIRFSNKTACSEAGKCFLIEIITARHVVFDRHEAKQTSFKYGYNSYNQGEEIPCVDARVAQGADWCKLKCITHDESLAKEITDKLSLYEKSANKLYKMYRDVKVKPKLAIVVSHPHGHYKQISIGFWCKQFQSGGVDVKYTYTASTCNGSSGAPVFILGRDGKLGLCTHIHSGCELDSPQKYNFSCCVFD